MARLLVQTGLPHSRRDSLSFVRTKEPVLKLGPSLTAFMSDLGLLPRGGRKSPIGRLREPMQRLFSATIAFEKGCLSPF